MVHTSLAESYLMAQCTLVSLEAILTNLCGNTYWCKAHATQITKHCLLAQHDTRKTNNMLIQHNSLRQCKLFTRPSYGKNNSISGSHQSTYASEQNLLCTQ